MFMGSGGDYDVGFYFFASSAVLWDGSAKDYESSFWRFLEKFEALLNFHDGVLNVFACSRGFNVRGGPILVPEHVHDFAYLLSRRNIKRYQFGAASFLVG